MRQPDLCPLYLVLSLAWIHTHQADLSHFASGCGNMSLSCPGGSVILVESVHYDPETDCTGEDDLQTLSGKGSERGTRKTTEKPPSPEVAGRPLWEAVVAKCSGFRNSYCQLNLARDLPEGLSTGGRLDVKYSCGENVNSYCGGAIQVGQGGHISTPGYPKYYLGGKDCLWALTAAQGQKVQLTIMDMSLRSEDCVQVQDGADLISEECGPSLVSRTFNSRENSITLRLRTSNSSQQHLFPKRGILAKYSGLGCAVPGPIADGEVTFINSSWAQFTCHQGHVFKSSLSSLRSVQCRDSQWREGLEHCVSVEFLLQYGDEEVVRSLQISYSQLTQSQDQRTREWSLEVGATVLVGSLLLISLIIGISLYIKFYASGSYYLQEDQLSLKDVKDEVADYPQPEKY